MHMYHSAGYVKSNFVVMVLCGVATHWACIVDGLCCA